MTELTKLRNRASELGLKNYFSASEEVLEKAIVVAEILEDIVDSNDHKVYMSIEATVGELSISSIASMEVNKLDKIIEMFAEGLTEEQPKDEKEEVTKDKSREEKKLEKSKEEPAKDKKPSSAKVAKGKLKEVVKEGNKEGKSIKLKESEEVKGIKEGSTVKFKPFKSDKEIEGEVKLVYKCHKAKYNEYCKILSGDKFYFKRVNSLTLIKK